MPAQSLNSNLDHAQLAIDNHSPIRDFDSKQQDPFWIYSNLAASRWNKRYPYQLMVVERKDNKYAKWRGMTFTLPIPPQDLQLSTPFAIGLSATLGGIVEEHNGAPIRPIIFSGTTGVAPLRSAAQDPAGASVGASIFAGTVQAYQVLKDTADVLSRPLTGQPRALHNTFSVNDTNDQSITSGYAQFRLLQMFFERYIALKKTTAGKDLRLAFAMWKDDAIYLVTPVAFDLKRQAASPLEYTYTLSMKAWRRIQLDSTFAPPHKRVSVVRDPNALAASLSKVRAIQTILNQSAKLLGAAGDDVLEVVRELTGFIKATLGAPFTLADMPASVIKSARSAALDLKNLEGAITDGGARTAQTYKEATSGWTDIQSASVASLSFAAKEHALGTGSDATQDPAEKAFDGSPDNFALMDSMDLGSLSLSPAVETVVAKEQERVRQLRPVDHAAALTKIQQTTSVMEAKLGALDDTVAAVYKLPYTNTETEPPTQEEWDVLFALNGLAMELQRFAASPENNADYVSTVDYVAGMAAASGIAFTKPVSKYAVPFPYGHTLEQVAERYLGTAQRWHELVALNGLRNPFVDEEGFSLSILAPGIDNTLVVAPSDNLQIGQSVWLRAVGVVREKRKILNKEDLNTTEIRLVLDGELDLDRFSPANDAVLEAFLPDTVNSRMAIYIPSTDQTDDLDYKTKAIPGVDEFDPLIRAGGVDLLLTAENDLVITPNGDCRLAIGLANLAQRVRIRAAKTLKVGGSVAELDAKELRLQALALFAGDSDLSVEDAQVRIVGPTASLGLSVRAASVNRLIPVSINLQ